MAEALGMTQEDQEILERPDVAALLERIADSVRVTGGRVEVIDEQGVRDRAIDELIHAAVFGDDDDLKDAARWLIGDVGAALNVIPASIHELYLARGRGETGGFTVPAINIRAASYDSARALFAASVELDVGALICEIARSEIGYTDQRPAEYVAVLTAAALKEGWSGPLFIQGDHFQVNAKKYASNPEPELQAVRDLIREAIHAGFYNLDVDTSTLVDLAHDTLEAQQEINCKLSAEFTALIRKLEPQGVTVSIGGEIGEVGTENSTPEELRAYMDGYNTELTRISQQKDKGLAGLSKISVQSGTSHGGVVLPDGSIADVAIDLDTLERLSEIARDEYGLAGAVQHGASTLPQSAFGRFPEIETAEIHLATGFQNIFYDHEQLPDELRDRMYEHCRVEFVGERKDTDTEEQFIYKTRKKALGAFKKELWELPEANRTAIRATLQEQFAFLLRQLKVDGTRETVSRFVKPRPLSRSGPTALRIKAAKDDWDLSD